MGMYFLAELAYDGQMLWAELAHAFLLVLMSHQGLPESWREGGSHPTESLK